ncbi:MAG TPA: hypothetical protein DCY88_09545 [Cyanobacteria bacterium UBA11372]|nr:hypothetical protein [Cyanobacteria bacterium UBA11372]
MASEEKKVTINVKILKEGERVLNVSHSGSSYYITVGKENGECYVCSLTLDENGNPRLEKTPPLTITFGEGEVEALVESAGEEIRVITC